MSLITLLPLGAETQVTAELEILQALSHNYTDEDTTEEWSYGGSGSADLSVQSTGSRDVRGELSLNFIPMDNLTLVNLDKASLKVQFPSLRITMGKTRIGWGDGQVFNAGDVLYGSLDPSVDLTADEARDDTALLTLVRYSMGRNYLEAIVMPATSEIDPTDTDSAEETTITQTSAGGRYVSSLGGGDLELGYLCKGQEKTDGDVTGHRPYLSLHGYGEVDWYGSASLAVPFENGDWEENTRETVNISAGLFRQFGLGYSGTLSARLEALLYPWGEWEEQAEADSYGLYLYPELVFEWGKMSVPVMAVLSPVDQSGQLTIGADWNVYQGFSFQGFASAALGGDNDTFHGENFSLMGGMKYKY